MLVILNACHPECSILMWDLPLSVSKQTLLRQANSLHVNHLCSHLNYHHRSLLISLVSSPHCNHRLRCTHHLNHPCSHLNYHHRSPLSSLAVSLHRVLRCLLSIHLSKVNYSISLFLFSDDCMLYVYHFSKQLLYVFVLHRWL